MLNLLNQKFGKLLAIEKAPNKGNKTAWKCVCDCGNITISRTSDLALGKSQSCGCVRLQKTTKHGLVKSIAYKRWQSMLGRCFQPSTFQFAQYGGRGITCDVSWKIFTNFHNDMGEPPTPKHTLDRINPNKNYFKENCRWATRKEQANNRRNNRILEYKGENKTVSEWANVLNMDEELIRGRLKLNWPVQEIFETPKEAQLSRERDATTGKWKTKRILRETR